MAKRSKLSAEKIHQRRIALLSIYGPHCFYCGVLTAENVTMNSNNLRTLDHVVPLIKGGSNCVTNMVLACNKCNNTRDVIDFLEFFNDKKLCMNAEDRRASEMRLNAYKDFVAHYNSLDSRQLEVFLGAIYNRHRAQVAKQAKMTK